MSGAKTRLTFLLVAFFSLVFTNQAVFAEEDLSVSISPNGAEMDVIPNNLTTATQTITVSTTNETGYIVSISPVDASNALVNQSDPTLIIPTFTLQANATSLPASSTGYGYGYSIDNGLNYLPMPTPNNSRQLFESDTFGEHEHTLTFGVLVSVETQKGTYINTAAIEVVAKLNPCPPETICYYGNKDDKTGTMPYQSASSNTETVLIAPNFSRSGYGFVSWNTSMDGSGTNYGPNETITTGDLSQEGLQLYAKWIQSTGDFQHWNGCDALNTGEVIALTDTRDGNVYTVTKHSDGHCWMMENLRLNLSNQNLQLSNQNTNNPTAEFSNTINTYHPASTNNFCASGNVTCINGIYFSSNNTNRSLTASYDANNTTSSWYSYGNYYNWHTITAGNGTFEDATAGSSVDGDICPASWRLPTGYGDDSEFAQLDIAMGGRGINITSPAATMRWRKYPYNFIFGGEQKGTTAANRAISSSYATQNVLNSERTANLWIKTDGVSMNSNTTYKYRGQTVRCVYKGDYNVIGNIHYDSNGGTGTMSDETDINFSTTVAANNSFTKQYTRFESWNTRPDGTGTKILAGSAVSVAAERLQLTEGDTLNLYAIWSQAYSLVYDGNGADAGSMDIAKVDPLQPSNQQLVASNFSRSGYGFAGWSLDNDAGNKLLNGQSVTVYGPNQTITIDNTFLENDIDQNTRQAVFYAVWIPENTTYTMQTFDTAACSAMAAGAVTALRDTRDNNIYTIAKLEDGNCWMTENLRLIPNTTTFTNDNTNSPTADFISNVASSATSNTLCNSNNASCDNSIRFNANNINRSLIISYNTNDTNVSWYSYGVMYNWYTATAGNGTYSMASGNAAGDICPSGWRLPTGGSNGDYAKLNRLANNNATNTIAGLVKFPDNFLRSGDYNNTIPGGRGVYGRYWTSTANNTNNAHRLGLGTTSADNITPAGSYNKWDGFAVRCIVK